MKQEKLSLIAGVSYLIIFFAAIFANFFVLESMKLAPMQSLQDDNVLVRLGIMAFIITVVFDVVVAWALNELYRENRLSSLSTLFRMMHAAIMAVAVYCLVLSLSSTSDQEVLLQLDAFNVIWLIGLFFFGIHLILLARIIGRPVFISVFLILAGIMYMVDTAAHFLLSSYDEYGSIFLALVAIPSILGEMSLAIYLLIQSRKEGITS